jgi:hypothetical protein
VVLAVIGVGLLILIGRRDLALFLGIAAALRAIGPVLNVLIASPRPTVEAVVIVAKAGWDSQGGHVMGAALFYGQLRSSRRKSLRGDLRHAAFRSLPSP